MTNMLLNASWVCDCIVKATQDDNDWYKERIAILESMDEDERRNFNPVEEYREAIKKNEAVIDKWAYRSEMLMNVDKKWRRFSRRLTGKW